MMVKPKEHSAPPGQGAGNPVRRQLAEAVKLSIVPAPKKDEDEYISDKELKARLIAYLEREEIKSSDSAPWETTPLPARELLQKFDTELEAWLCHVNPIPNNVCRIDVPGGVDAARAKALLKTQHSRDIRTAKGKRPFNELPPEWKVKRPVLGWYGLRPPSVQDLIDNAVKLGKIADMYAENLKFFCGPHPEVETVKTATVPSSPDHHQAKNDSRKIVVLGSWKSKINPVKQLRYRNDPGRLQSWLLKNSSDWFVPSEVAVFPQPLYLDNGDGVTFVVSDSPSVNNGSREWHKLYAAEHRWITDLRTGEYRRWLYERCKMNPPRAEDYFSEEERYDAYWANPSRQHLGMYLPGTHREYGCHHNTKEARKIASLEFKRWREGKIDLNKYLSTLAYLGLVAPKVKPVSDAVKSADTRFVLVDGPRTVFDAKYNLLNLHRPGKVKALNGSVVAETSMGKSFVDASDEEIEQRFAQDDAELEQVFQEYQSRESLDRLQWLNRLIVDEEIMGARVQSAVRDAIFENMPYVQFWVKSLCEERLRKYTPENLRPLVRGEVRAAVSEMMPALQFTIQKCISESVRKEFAKERGRSDDNPPPTGFVKDGLLFLPNGMCGLKA